jgi:RNAse (barnase) inhibitor barstar
MKEKKYDIRSIEFKEVENPFSLQDTLHKTLELPDFYGRNWDAFWDSITEIVKMPSNLILYNIKDYEDKYPEDAKKLIKIKFDYNDFVNREVILFDYTNELQQDTIPCSIECIFRRRPFQYGLRGDPYLWNELEDYFKSKEIPETEDRLVEQIHIAVEELINNSLKEMKNIFVERYNSGGMSSGYVCSDFWMNCGIPLLIGRYRKLIKS